MADRTPEEILEEARKLIGAETKRTPSRYPVEYEPIRRYCHMVGDDNPLFLEPEYAKSTRYGTVIAPPFYIRNMSGPGLWPAPTEPAESLTSRVPTAGRRTINLNTEFKVLKPIKVGDRISKYQRLADVYIKPIRLDPKAFWIVYETVYIDENDEQVLIERNTLCMHRSPDEVRAAGDAPPQ